MSGEVSTGVGPDPDQTALVMADRRAARDVRTVRPPVRL